MLRPASTRWFEALCPRGESVRTVAELARTGAIEVEIRRNAEKDFPIQDLSRLEEYRTLLRRYGRYWARGSLRPSSLKESPSAALEHALVRIGDWRREADPVIDALQECEEERTRIKWLSRIIDRVRSSALDFDLVTCSGPLLGTFCAILPREVESDLPDWVIARAVPWEDERCFLILGPAQRLEQVKHRIKGVKGRIIERPHWLRGDARVALKRLNTHREFLSVRIVHLYAELDSLFEDFDLGTLLGESAWLDWFATGVGGLELASDHLVWITGWTDDLSGESLVVALERSDSRALIRFSPPPEGVQPPQVLDNPPWMKPFETFALAFGVPGGDEVDPTPVLAVVVPLLFGYMFGDLGQGAVLVALGWSLRGRFELAPLLMAGGASAMVFGLLFGSLFALEHLAPALWLHPMDDPLTVLLVPLGFAVLLLSLGQLLDGLGALWRGEIGRWLLMDAGFLMLYLGLIGLFAGLPSGWLVWGGSLWYLIGSWLVHKRVLGAIAALGHLLERGMQILVNTLSFARVGAFALAHSALSAAVVTMAEAASPGPGWLLILVLGNLLIICLEGLVVSIQTTRLVLFEFFNRFLVGTGRVFRPLQAPPTVVGQRGEGTGTTVSAAATAQA